MKFRYISLTIGTLLVLFLLWATTPGAEIIQVKYGADTIRRLTALAAAYLGVLFLYLGTKSLTDMVKLEEVYRKAMESPTGAGLAFIAVALIFIAVSGVIQAVPALFA